MGSSDRDYLREESRRQSSPPKPPVTVWLIVINAVIFVAGMVKDEQTGISPLETFGAFSIAGLLKGHVWELLTFQFLHANLGHVAFNCLGIWVFGPFVENWWGSRRYLAYYLLCGAAGAAFFSLLAAIHLIPDASVYTPLVGASAGIYGLLIATYVLAPHARVRLLFPPIEMSMKQMALLWIGLAVAVILGDLVLGWAMFSNSGGEAGHLGGVILGFILMKNPGWLGKGGGREDKIIRPAVFKKRRQEPKLRPRSEFTREEASEVDRILDKINRDGFESLTGADREILQRASKPKDPTP
jgi:membrane associated rhomboid family serine protease